MSAVLAYAVNKSSGNWGLSIDPSQSVRSSLRASGSFNPAALHASRNKAAAAGAGSSPEKDDKGAGRRPCAPARVPSAAPNRDVQAAAAAAGAAAAAAGAAAAAKHAEEKEDDEVSRAHVSVEVLEQGSLFSVLMLAGC